LVAQALSPAAFEFFTPSDGRGSVKLLGRLNFHVARPPAVAGSCPAQLMPIMRRPGMASASTLSAMRSLGAKQSPAIPLDAGIFTKHGLGSAHATCRYEGRSEIRTRSTAANFRKISP
jgi:hypothetical protein